MAGHALICGGSIGGLFTAAALLGAGWRVDVYERSGVELSGRGAGIVTHPQLIDALAHVGADITDLGVRTSQRAAFDRAGNVVATLDYHQIVTSWDRIQQSLRALIPNRAHHLGRAAVGYSQSKDHVTVQFECGSSANADILIGADGFRSAIRGQMAPSVQPAYAGYVVWRALADERDLPPDIQRDIFGRFGFYLPAGHQIIGYPIAGQGNDLRTGHRRYNFVWYVQVPKADLTDMLTDSTGRQHAMTIPPPLVRGKVVQDMYQAARDLLPPAFAQILDKSERPFFTPIYDHHTPVMANGRVALVGDAACVARPHVGMGVTKAAEDACALARHLGGLPVRDALAAYSAERVPAALAAYERSQLLGGWMCALNDNPHGCRNPNLTDIMRLTAVADF